MMQYHAKAHLLAALCLMLSTGLARAGNTGHRMGGDVFAPENTLLCYKQAVENLQGRADFHYVELDIQETKDGQVVVFHDTDGIKRMVPRNNHNLAVLEEVLRRIEFDKIRISDLTLSQISELTLESNARIPSLEEVLEASVRWKLRKPMLIEIKSLRSDQCRYNLIALVARFSGSLEVDFLAFEKNFDRSFPDPLRWKAVFKKNGLKVYVAKKPKTAEFDLAGDVAENAMDWHFETVLAEQPFSIGDEGSRILRFPIKLPRTVPPGCALRIGIHHGNDDSGDKGLRFRLVDAEGNELAAGFVKSKRWEWFETPLGTEQKRVLFLEDSDTKFAGKYPGNGGAVKATVVFRTRQSGCKLMKGDLGDVGELAVEVVVVEAVADDKVVVDREAGMVGLEFDGAVRLFVE